MFKFKSNIFGRQYLLVDLKKYRKDNVLRKLWFKADRYVTDIILPHELKAPRGGTIGYRFKSGRFGHEYLQVGSKTGPIGMKIYTTWEYADRYQAATFLHTIDDGHRKYNIDLMNPPGNVPDIPLPYPAAPLELPVKRPRVLKGNAKSFEEIRSELRKALKQVDNMTESMRNNLNYTVPLSNVSKTIKAGIAYLDYMEDIIKEVIYRFER